jgi:hypothetical protein
MRKDISDKIKELFAGQTVADMTEWEQGFVNSVVEQVELRGIGSLSEKQEKIIHIMYDKHEDSL